MKRTDMKRTNTNRIFLLAVFLFALSYAYFTLGTPTGVTLTSNTTNYGPTIGGLSLTHNRSTITTVVLNAVQQDQRWKAYIGNVTGSLTLDDSDNQTIYDWSNVNAAAGEVYTSRSSGLTFASVQCADAATVGAEETALNMTAGAGGEIDNINNTFNNTDHTSTNVGATPLSGCPMVATYVSDADQGQNSSADFQEFLMEDATNNLIYVSIMNDNTLGYDGASNFDFQMIVAESDVQATANTYYFWVELDG